LAFTAANSFRKEQESGALELLLVTPLRVSQILWGRLRGIWSQFLPATLVLALAWGFLASNAGLYSTLHSYDEFWGELDLLPTLFLPAYLSVPALGLYFSLRVRNGLAAWVWTSVIGLVVPGFILGPILFWLARMLLRATLSEPFAAYGARLLIVLLELAIGVLGWLAVHHRFSSRAFAGQRSNTTPAGKLETT
jgi:ABC-type Na+ efflux pump permease subunit